MNPRSNFTSFVLRFLESSQVPLLHTCVKSQWASRPEEGVRKHCSGRQEENDRISQDWPKILCEASVASFEVADTQREREVTACNFQTTRHTVSHSWRHRKKHENSCRLWDKHSREHTVSHSWRYTVSLSWSHTDTQCCRRRHKVADFETHKVNTSSSFYSGMASA